jgi:hypothetical protein
VLFYQLRCTTSTYSWFNAAGKTTRAQFDTWDTSGHNIGGGNTSYDANGVKTGSSTYTTIGTYDSNGRQLTTQRTISNFDATGNKVSFEYGENGNQIYFANAPSSDNKFVGYANIKQNLIIDHIDATKADFNFNIYEGQNSYTFNIAGFNTGDKLSFSNSTSTPKITNTNTSDGIIDVVCNTTTIHLTGLTSVQDQAITSDIATFNNIFGTGAIGTI